MQHVDDGHHHLPPPIQLDGLAKQWEVDGDGLLAKLRALTPTQALAVIDAAERWWLAKAAAISMTHV